MSAAASWFRQHGAAVLVGANVVLAAGLAALWLDEQGNLRNVTWTPPEAQPPVLAALVPPAAGGGGDADVGRYVATLDRPLFSPSRRPPPPPPPPAPPPPVDPLANVQLFGVYGGKDSGGVLARFNGKVQRVRLNEAIGEWTVKEISGREVTFARGEETRSMRLVHVIGPRPAAAPADGASPPTAGAPAGMPLDRAASMAQDVERARERLRERNELFRKAGLPPVKE